MARASGAKLHTQTFGEEVQHFLRRRRMHAAVMPGLAGQCDQRNQVQRPFSRMMRMMPRAARRRA